MAQIKTVKTKKDWEEFIGLPWKIYAHDSVWVPPLRIAVKDLLDVSKNPFFKHAYMHPLLAYEGRECVGRMVGVIDDNHNKFHKETTGFFGFFECIDSEEVASQLFEEVSKWVKDRGMTKLRGPLSPSTNHECGLLVDGFDDSPYVMMTYNPKYYEKLITNFGLKKEKDLLAFVLTSDTPFEPKLIRVSDRLKKRNAITFRSIDMKNFETEIERILEVYNDAWEQNWGFVPMNSEEFRHMAKDMKAIVDPRILMIAEVKGDIAGFALTLPDVNQVFKKVPDGKLLPTGIFKLLWNLKGPGRKTTIDRCRILTLGIKRKYRELGLGSLFFTEIFQTAPPIGYPTGEASWILEDNFAMVKACEYMRAKKSKVYRIFDKNL